MITSRKFLQGALIVALLALPGCSTRNSEYSILFGGDLMLARAGATFQFLESNSSDAWGDVLKVVDRSPGSFFVANLESPLGTVDPELQIDNLKMNLCAPPGTVSVLVEGGIGLVTQANNHSDDCGTMERDQTRSKLAEAGIQLAPSSSEPFSVEISNNDVAFFAVNAYSGEGNFDNLIRNIEIAAQENDLVVVSLHWGNEYQAGPDANQEKLAQRLVDAGADILWGHHPHVLQRMEWRSSKVDGHTALVMYSLGNLISDQWMLDDTLQTALIKITFKKSEIVGITIIPMVFDRESNSLQYPETNNVLEKILQRMDLEGIKKGGIEVDWKSEPFD